jgi:hypothetical protein
MSGSEEDRAEAARRRLGVLPAFTIRRKDDPPVFAFPRDGDSENADGDS